VYLQNLPAPQLKGIDLMTLKALLPLVRGAILALAACTNPYDPGQRAVGGLPGAIGGVATTPTPSPPQQGDYKPTPSPPAAGGGPLDLADTAAGVYYGNVISDARGAGRSGVTIIVTKTALPFNRSARR
jgi:hypothetical protein